MDDTHFSEMFQMWNVSGTAGQCAFGPVHELKHTKNRDKLASALIFPVPASRQQLQSMRSSGMDDLQIMRQLQSEVETFHGKCVDRKIPGLLRCIEYGQTRQSGDLGWNVGIVTERVVPLSARLDLVTTDAQILAFAEAAAGTLDACRQKGISLGQLTPDRIFVTPGGEFRLTDLRPADAGVSDAAALGLLLHWLLSGHQGPFPTPGTVLPELAGRDPGLCALVMTAAQGGVPSSAELVRQLKKLPHGSNPPQKEKKKKPLLLILGAAVAAAAAAIALILPGFSGPGPASETDPVETVPTMPAVLSGWSDWAEAIPKEVTTDKYLVQEQPLYRTQVLENTSSITDTALEGWTFVETVDERGEFLEWSPWADTAPEENPDREIESSIRYQTNTKEFSTGSSETKSGWALYDTTSERTDFGSWGSWSTDKVSSSDSRDVESKQQYRSREKEYTTSDRSSLEGWNQYDLKHSYGEWGGWSSWSDSPIESSDTCEVKTQQVEIPGETTYTYGAYFSSNSPKVPSTFAYACGTCASRIYGGDWSYKTFTTPHKASSKQVSYSCAHTSTRNRYSVGSKLYYYETVETSPSTYKTQYSCRTRSKSTTYYYSRWGSWGDWQDSKLSPSSERDVQDRTVYRSRSCVTNYTYHFYRWSGWSDWTETPASPNDITEVQTKDVYRYRDREIIPTHYFVRWSDWSEYGPAYAAPTETQHVQALLQLRYCQREQTEQTQEWPYTDVTAEHPNYESVRWIVDRGITKGTSETTFSPEGTFTRRQMAIMFWRALSYPEPMNQQMTLTDMPLSDPYRKAINWAVESGIADVVVPGTFGSDQVCTRGDFILALYRAVGCPSVTLAQEPFTDVSPEMPIYNAVLWAYERGISHGLDTTSFGTDLPCTRLQAAAMLHRALSQPVETPAPAETTAPAE